MRWRFALAALAGLLASPAMAVDCDVMQHDGRDYSVCKVDVEAEELRLFLNHPETGDVLGSFGNVDALVSDQGKALRFAMNAGMYHQDRSPVGHYVEDGEERMRIIASAGPGNFGLLPNGIFCIQDGAVLVSETKRFQAEQPECRFATQSGPMLVIDGKLHPRFLPDSDSRYVRNGVGVSDGGKIAWFVISHAPVTFHEIAVLFRDELKTPQALYFDGNISKLYAPDLGRHDGGFPMGPIVGVVAPAE